MDKQKDMLLKFWNSLNGLDFKKLQSQVIGVKKQSFEVLSNFHIESSDFLQIWIHPSYIEDRLLVLVSFITY